MDRAVDEDPVETREWRDALDSVLAFEGAGAGRASCWASCWTRRAARAPRCPTRPTRRISTPSRRTRRRRTRATGRSSTGSARYIRWNAMAIVLRANKESSELGGHIASFQSAATLYDTGFMHFWHGADRRSMAATWSTSRATRSPGHLRARLPRGPADRGAAAQLPPGGRRRGPLAPTRIPG